MMKSKYNHNTGIHNLKDPQVIAPLIYDKLKPRSVIDIGCGLGTFARAFKDLGTQEILGIDGHWNDPHLRKQFLNNDEFNYHDLEKPLKLQKKYDLAISLEVAEHISESSARTFVHSLVEASDIVLFSAAIPYQGGQNHINEQWPYYWEMLFNELGYSLVDCIRAKIWNDPEIYWWYKQNIYVAINRNREDLMETFREVNFKNNNLFIHADHFLSKAEELYSIQGGNKSLIFYFKLLTKGILNKFGFKFYQNNHT